MRMSSALCLALVACGADKGPTETGTPPGTPSGTASGTTTTGLPTGGTTSQRSAVFTGQILDCAGDPLADVEVRFCDTLNCRYHTTVPGDSSFEFRQTMVGWNSFEAVGPPGYVTGFVPLLFGVEEERAVDMHLCPHDAPTGLGSTPAEVAMGEGMYITLSTDAIEPPLFVDPATEAAGRRLDPSQFVPADEISGTVAAQWFVVPFNHKATDPGGLPVRFDGAALGLAGASYTAYVGSYDDFAWLEVGTFSDGDADGWYTSDSGAGLPLLGTVMLVEP